jgi:hypothetical protein
VKGRLVISIDGIASVEADYLLRKGCCRVNVGDKAVNPNLSFKFGAIVKSGAEKLR